MNAYNLFGILLIAGGIAAFVFMPDKNGHSLATAIFYGYRLEPTDIEYYLTSAAPVGGLLLAVGIAILVLGHYQGALGLP